MSNYCRICFEEAKITKLLIENDENDVKYSEKLQKIVPEIEWLGTYLICQDCIIELNLCYEFRKKCIEKEAERKYFVSKNITDHQVLSEKELTDKVIICFNCENTFETKEALQEHIEKVHSQTTKRKSVDKKKFTCEYCSTKFVLLKTLIKHCKDEHKIDVKNIRAYLCEVCNLRFRTGANLTQHKSYQHNSDSTHLCTICGKNFKTRSDLTFHGYIHSNKRNYKCMQCNKAYNTNKNLRAHILVVHTDRNLWKHPCSYCQKKFPLKSNYDQHVKRHFGEKNFTCELCDKSFISKGEMTKHMMLHSNIANFKCTECDKEYKLKMNLEIHLTKDHGIGNAKLPLKYFKKYSCNICSKEFNDKETLFQHLCLNTKEDLQKNLTK